MIEDLRERQRYLVASNISCLRQLEVLLNSIDDETYVAAPAQMPDQRAGGHVRHVIEFYDCFLNGLELSHVDYDSRKRDYVIEASRTAALSKIGALLTSLE